MSPAKTKPHLVITDKEDFVYEAILEREGIAPTTNIVRPDEYAKIDWKRFGAIYLLEGRRRPDEEALWSAAYDADATERIVRIWD